MSDRILVIGGAGYIGSHACKALAQADYQPIVFDNLVYGHRWAVKWGPLEEGDLLDPARVDEVLAKWKPKAVMHFAAYAYVGESVCDPGKYYRNNVIGSLNLLEAMHAHGIGKLVFSSTCAVYGVPERLPLTEDHPQQPINPYGSSKRMVEQMLRDFDQAHGLRSISLRYFNAAGADPDGEIGEAHDPETHLIPLVLDAASGARDHIAIYGSDYPTPDGTCIRDYIHVSDLADAHVLALRALEQGRPTEAFNLGNGRGYSVREVIDCVQSVTGKSISIQTVDRRPGDPAQLVGDAARIRKELAWSPKHAGLRTIVESAWQWHQSAPATINEASRHE